MLFSDIDIEFADNEISEAADVLRQNIMFFCNTPLGSLPQQRGYGLDYSILDTSFSVLRMRATVDIVSAVRKYYDVQISSIDITASESGNINLKIII